jgi:2-hydroxychromene-2-carboxylate isomerase
MATLHFWFDYSCPYAYLASTQVAALASRTGAALVYEPMLLGGVFRAVGTPQRLFETLSAQKARHNGLDMQRWADLFGVTLRMPSAHPMRTVEALRATLLTGIDPGVVDGFYRAYWVEGRPPSDEATLRDVLARAGHDAGAILAKLDDAKDDLRVRTDRAIAHGIFGAPAFVVDGEMYWGQDRLDFVERALTKTRDKHAPNQKRG